MTLLEMNERDGYTILRRQLPDLDADAQSELVKLLKREADRHWPKNAQLSNTLAGHLLSIGDLTKNRYAHAIGLMTRGESLRRMERDAEAIEYLDAAGDEFLE